MFGSKILDVAIGLVFVYIIVSVLCTAVREGIEAFLKTRAAYLEHGIRLLLQNHAGNGIVKDVFDHPLIDGLFMGNYKPRSTTGRNRPWTGGNLPSYIPSKSFASALLDIAARGPAGASLARYNTPISLEAIRRNVVANIPGNPKIQRIVLHAVDAAQGDLDKAQKSIEDWYDSAMDRVSGWYKRTTHFVVLVIGLLIAVGMNVNSIAIIDKLYKSDATRDAVVAAASSAADRYNKADENANSPNPSPEPAKQPDNAPAPSGAAKGTTNGAAPVTSTTTTSIKGTSIGTGATAKSAADAFGQKGNGPYDQAKQALDDLHLPVGWDNAKFSIDPDDWPRNQDQWFMNFLFPWIGWILTALAASLGAPFWFDVLNKFMVIRSTVKPHEKSPEESSEDRQQPGGTTIVVGPGGGTPPPAPPGAGQAAASSVPDQEADGCDVLQTSALNLTDDSQLPV
jgi:hypothetical protein